MNITAVLYWRRGRINSQLNWFDVTVSSMLSGSFLDCGSLPTNFAIQRFKCCINSYLLFFFDFLIFSLHNVSLSFLFHTQYPHCDLVVLLPCYIIRNKKISLSSNIIVQYTRLISGQCLEGIWKFIILLQIINALVATNKFNGRMILLKYQYQRTRIFWIFILLFCVSMSFLLRLFIY